MLLSSYNNLVKHPLLLDLCQHIPLSAYLDWQLIIQLQLAMSECMLSVVCTILFNV